MELTGGDWGEDVPAIVDGTYLWTRSKITYTDGTVAYAGAYCMSKAMEETMEPAMGGVREAITRQGAEMNILSDAIDAAVSRYTEDLTGVQEELAEMALRADELTLRFQNVLQNGVDQVTTQTGYTFNAEGLDIHKQGDEIHNQIDNTGMYVKRAEGDRQEVMLQANAGGVTARDVSIQNFLILGSHARLEDYDTNRTACFYI